MGKLLNLLLLVTGIEISMNLFLGVSTPGTSLLNLVLNPTVWTSSGVIEKITGLTTLAGLGLVTIGSLVYKSDFFIFGGLAAMFLSYGMVFMEFYQKLYSVPGLKESPLVIIIIAPMIVAYLYVILKFWRGWD